ncbi:MAG TPA: putative quinol monooxygenase [Propionibacteriaceae bacterium]|nr:putative quinol monooxygenase [Propionibacteriaceae bacterium]
MSNGLLIVHVDVSVLSDRVDDFLAATEINASATRLEPGVVRFDVLRDRDDTGHVVLVEVYRDDEAAAAHKTTGHYADWRGAVAPMMARPRRSTRFVNISPDDADW